MVWVSCEGENPADVENIGSIQYIPRRGFPSYYFPYLNTEGYLPPLVAVYFENPRRKYLNLDKAKSWTIASLQLKVWTIFKRDVV